MKAITKFLFAFAVLFTAGNVVTGNAQERPKVKKEEQKAEEKKDKTEAKAENKADHKIQKAEKKYDKKEEKIQKQEAHETKK